MPSKDVVWLFLLLIAVGAAAMFINGAASFVAVPAIVMILLLISKRYFRSSGQNEKQTLVASFPAVPKVNRKVFILLVERDDYEIIRFLQKHGKTISKGETIIIRYTGKQIYYPTLNFFRFNNRGYKPVKVHVDSVSGFDLLTWQP